MKKVIEIVVVVIILSVVSGQTSTAPPYFLIFNLNSTQSRTVLQPFLNQNPIIDSQLNNITPLTMNTSFSSLFNYILSNSTIYNQLLPNISTITPFAWTRTMTQL